MYAGIPSICIPLAGGQFINSSLVEHHGIGIYVNTILIDESGKKGINLNNFENDLENALPKVLDKG